MAPACAKLGVICFSQAPTNFLLCLPSAALATSRVRPQHWQDLALRKERSERGAVPESHAREAPPVIRAVFAAGRACPSCHARNALRESAGGLLLRHTYQQWIHPGIKGALGVGMHVGVGAWFSEAGRRARPS